MDRATKYGINYTQVPNELLLKINHMQFRFFLFAFVLVPFIFSCSSKIDSQWKGANRDGIYLEENLMQEWPEGGPDLLWRYDSLNMGHSSPAVTNKAIYLTGMKDSTNGYLYCLDLNGNFLWSDRYGEEFKTNYTGSRSTPAVAGNYLYIISGLGEVICYNLKTRSKKWTRSFIDDFGAESIEYGNAESVLIQEDKLYCTPGGEEHNVVCLDRYSGDLVWSCKGNGEKATYSSPIIANHNGSKILVTVTEESILGIDSRNGNLLWSVKYKPKFVNHINTPVYYEGNIYMATEAFKDEGGFLAIKISEDGSGAEVLWERRDIRNLLSGFIVKDGRIYSCTYRKSDWHCLDAYTGQTLYNWSGYDYGTISYSDNRFYILSNDGSIFLGEASDKELNHISNFKMDIELYYPFAPLWAPPVITNGRMYIRHKGSLFVYNISRV